MKSKVASSWTWRARSLRKMAAPLSTPTKITAWPEKSRVISAPIAATRCAICSREIRTLSSVTANYIKLALGIWHLAFSRRTSLLDTAGLLRDQVLITKLLASNPNTMNLNGIKLNWLGHATFRIETPGGKTILIDPWGL